MGNIYGPQPPRLDGDDIIRDLAAGGKPKTTTPKDKRLKENQPGKAKPAPKPKGK